MQTPTHPWLPTTKSQSVLVYGLNVLLLFNVTVIIVLLSRPSSTGALASNAPADEPIAEAEHRRVQGEPAESEPVVAFEPVVDARVADVTEAVQPTIVGTEPYVLVDAPVDPREEVLVDHQPQSTAQDDPPVQFFGIGIE